MVDTGQQMVAVAAGTFGRKEQRWRESVRGVGERQDATLRLAAWRRSVTATSGGSERRRPVFLAGD